MKKRDSNNFIYSPDSLSFDLIVLAYKLYPDLFK